MKPSKNLYFILAMFFLALIFGNINRYDHGWNGENVHDGYNLFAAILSGIFFGVTVTCGILAVDEKDETDET